MTLLSSAAGDVTSWLTGMCTAVLISAVCDASGKPIIVTAPRRHRSHPFNVDPIAQSGIIICLSSPNQIVIALPLARELLDMGTALRANRRAVFTSVFMEVQFLKLLLSPAYKLTDDFMLTAFLLCLIYLRA